jgi:hypothetical protein
MTCATDWSLWLSTCANIAQVVTGIVAGILGLSYVGGRRARRGRLENYLKAVKANDAKGVSVFELGRRTIAHLMAHLAMTEAQVLEAGFGNPKRVKSFPATDDKTGRAETLYFHYVGDEKSN